MAAVNQNMFDASIATERPRGALLMVLPLNLIAQIVSNVSSLSPRKTRTRENADNTCDYRSMILAILPGYVEHVASSIIWRCRSSIAA